MSASASREWTLSIRARLALWYSVALGVLLLVVASATYGILARTTASDADRTLEAVAAEVAGSLQLAMVTAPRVLAADSGIVTWAAQRTFANHRFREIGIAIFRARAATAVGVAQLRLLAVDTPTAGVRAAGGRAGTAPMEAMATRALTRMEPVLETLAPHRERAVALPVMTRRGLFVVALSTSLDASDTVLRRVREATIVGVPLALVLAMSGGFLLAGVSLRPVEAMRRRAEQIGARTLHERLPVSRPADELARLSQTFNALLDRVEEAFELRRRFTADASHELRTPVAVIIGESELALAAPRSPEAYRAALAVIHAEARRLAIIVGDLFLLARGDAAEQTLVPVPLFVEELVGDCVDALASLARAKRITLQFVPESEVPVVGDPAMLRRIVTNLIDNAVKYTPVDGTITVSAEPVAGGGGVIRVRDTGIGIAPEHQPRIFERFYRVQHHAPVAGVPDAGGAGLGLPIASWIARAHGGTLQLTESGPAGSTFELRLSPAPPPAG
ncbi:MAG: HAMP domain-containing histidine kinase [Gemmatimonadaceae bacterium]|nr:HAMP domain-containing histidine kinase [Gemmatimonadaceae bacterium]